MNTNQLWRDGTLRETRLVVNGLPDAGEVGLPDEVFLGEGESEVQIIKRGPVRGNVWVVGTPLDWEGRGEYDGFAEAFAHALALVREAVE